MLKILALQHGGFTLNIKTLLNEPFIETTNLALTFLKKTFQIVSIKLHPRYMKDVSLALSLVENLLGSTCTFNGDKESSRARVFRAFRPAGFDSCFLPLPEFSLDL